MRCHSDHSFLPNLNLSVTLSCILHAYVTMYTCAIFWEFGYLFSLSLRFIVLIFPCVIHKISRHSWRFKFRIFWQLTLTKSVITVVIIRPSCRSRISKIRYLFAKIWSSPRLFRKFKLFAKITLSLSQDHSYYGFAYCDLSRVQTQSVFLCTSV